MKKLAVAAIAVSVLALILSFVGLVAGTSEKDHDTSKDVTLDEARDEARNEAVAKLARQVASLERELENFGSQQRALAERTEELAVQPKKLAASPAFDSAEINAIIDERTRRTVALATGKARLSPDDLPEVVMVSAAKALEGGKIDRAELRNKNGRSEYRLRARLDGKKYDLKISPDGEIIEAEMPPDRAPQVVKDAAAKAAEGIEIDQVTLEMDKDEGRQVYDVEGKVGDENYDMIITPDGQVIEVDGPDGKVRFDTKPVDANRPTDAF